MGIASLQVCMDSADWLQGGIQEDSGIDSSSPSGDMLTCSRPLIIERRLRPQHDQALKCPRCDSTHTKFCYYNNYSLSQPRYFCKTCRRYWTKGGTLRNIPVGGGCRKNKKIIPKKENDHNHDHNLPTDLHLSSSSSSFPEVQFSHLTNFSDFMVENPIRPVDFMERKIEDIVGNSRNYVEFGDMGNINMGLGSNFHGFCSPFGISLDHGNSAGNLMDTCQRLMVPYEGNEDQNGLDLKPNTKVLSLDWQGQGCSDAGKEYSFGYTDGLGSWTGLMNGYGASAATNPLV